MTGKQGKQSYHLDIKKNPHLISFQSLSLERDPGYHDALPKASQHFLFILEKTLENKNPDSLLDKRTHEKED